MKALILCLFISLPAFAGDSDGGGGGTLPKDPTTKNHIFDLVQNANRDLRLFLRYQQNEYLREPKHTALDDKLWGGKRTMLDVLESTDVEVRMTRPCFDKNQKAWDGSIYSVRPNAICISPFRMAPKLMDENARKETEALLLHELSHLLGTTEAEATAFQKSAADMFKLGHDSSATEMLAGIYASMANGHEIASSTAESLDKLPSQEIVKRLFDINYLNQNYWPTDAQLNFSLLTRNEYAYHQEVEQIRSELATDYAMGESDQENHQYWHDYYAAYFGDKTEITVKEYWEKSNGIAPPELFFPNEKIQRLTGREDLRAYLRSMDSYFWHQWARAIRINEGDSLDLLPGPWVPTANPWTQYVGAYEVTSQRCKGAIPLPKTYKSFAIVLENAQPVLKYNDGIDDYSEGLFYGADDFGGASVSIGGNGATAFRRAEQETSWGKDWVIRDWTMSNDHGQLRLTRHQYERTQTWDKTSESASDCELDLRRAP